MGTEFSSKLEEALKEQNMTQKELAQKANITESAVSHYVKGDREPRSSTVGVIAGILGVSAGFLLGTALSNPGQERNKQTFDELKSSILKNKDILTKEQKFELIQLLSR